MRKKTFVSYVRDGFDLMVPTLEEYIGREVVSVFGNRSWDVIREKLDARDIPHGGPYEECIRSLDLQKCLQVIDRLWQEVFKKRQSIDFRTYSKELMGFRNKISHLSGGQDFDEDDAWRALDTAKRFMETVDDETANELGDLLRELRYGSREGSAATQAAGISEQTRKIEGVMASNDLALPSWRDIIRPHPDVAEGLYQKAEFAADLAQVARHDKRTALEYADPVEFFSRTYITEGMRGLLIQALERISGRGGDPVIQLKTAFGGGKTHSMLALYHMLRGSAPLVSMPVLEPVLKEAGLSALPKANIAVLVGTSLDPASVKRPNDFPGITVNTLWGEMAMQLAKNADKPELYNIIREADRRHVSPGSEKLKELLDAAGPCLILMDELVAYGKKIYGSKDLPAGTFDNFITFIQELTEAARASENSLVVASIPESQNEIGGESGEITLDAIEHTFGRMETIWKPVGLDEGFEVVRRRLFLDCSNPKVRDEVCEAYSAMYQKEKEHFPYDAKSLAYLERMKACYPIHPEIFDRLFSDWASLEKFQRTRGVLRLMASVIHTLWMGGDASSMILPGTLPLDEPAVRDELTRNLPEGWNSIVLSDVAGKRSWPYKIDAQKTYLGKYLASQRVARDIFLGSAPSTASQSVRGMDRNQIHLGVVQPGEPISTFNDALASMMNRCTYLNSASNGRYWYDLRPTLLKTANDKINQIREEACLDLIEKRIKDLAGKDSHFKSVHTCPKTSLDVSDQQEMRLVILRPDQTWVDNRPDDCKAAVAALEILSTRGSSPRQYRNTLLFVAPVERQKNGVIAVAKEWLAWHSILDERVDLNLDQKQIRDVENSVRKKDEILKSRVLEYYKVLLIPRIDLEYDPKLIDLEPIRLESGDSNVARNAAETAMENEGLITNIAPKLLRPELQEFVWERQDSIEVRDLWNYLTTYLYMPKLQNYEVLKECLLAGVQDTGYFGLAGGFADGRFENLKYAQHVQYVQETDLLVEPSVAANQKVREAAEPVQPTRPESAETSSDSSSPVSVGMEPEPGSSRPPVTEEPPKVRHFSMTKSDFDLARINRQMSDIVTEILSQLDQSENNEIQITLSVNAFAPDGLSSSQQRTLAENCRSLKIDDFKLD